MSFTNQKPFIATKTVIKEPWSGCEAIRDENTGELYNPALRCRLCGYRFKEGDKVRFIQAGAVHLPNFFVCHNCDPDQDNGRVLRQALIDYNFAKEKFWYLFG